MIVISIGVAKTPDIIQLWRPAQKLANSTLTESVVSSNTVNSIPLTAIVLALVASCNSGKKVGLEAGFSRPGNSWENFFPVPFPEFLSNIPVFAGVYFLHFLLIFFHYLADFLCQIRKKYLFFST